MATKIAKGIYLHLPDFKWPARNLALNGEQEPSTADRLARAVLGETNMPLIRNEIEVALSELLLCKAERKIKARPLPCSKRQSWS